MTYLNYLAVIAAINNGLLVESLDQEVQPVNYFHNILRLFDALPNFPFTTSETMLDCNL